MSYIVRLYCPEMDRGGRLNNYERTETQVIRMRKADYYSRLFKLYTFCTDNGVTTTNGEYESITNTDSISDSFPIFNTNILFSYFNPTIHFDHIEWTIFNDNNEIVSEGASMIRYNDTFSIKLPMLERGNYKLQTSYSHNGDEYTHSFPLIVTS